jgi:hypothetical protein
MSPELTLLREENYPNIYRFTADVALITDNFTGSLDCKRLAEVYPDNSYAARLRDWFLALYRRVIG